jgi:hypothetical protein
VRAKIFGWWLALALVTPAHLASTRERQVVLLRAQDGRGHPFDLERVRGQVVAITFASRRTREEAAHVHQELLGQGDVFVVSVIDLVGIPGLFHGYARRKAAEHDRQGRIVNLVDEHGELKRMFQADPGSRVDILVVDRDGVLRGRFVGSAQLPDALRLVDELRVSSAQLGDD